MTIFIKASYIRVEMLCDHVKQIHE